MLSSYLNVLPQDVKTLAEEKIFSDLQVRMIEESIHFMKNNKMYSAMTGSLLK